jgi:cation:H+ antiporter
LQFLLSAGVIAVSGIWLAPYGDVIAERSQLGGTCVGVRLVAPVTSVPELVNGISSVTLAKAPYIALGDGLEAASSIPADRITRFFVPGNANFSQGKPGTTLVAGFSIMLIGLVAFSLLSGDPATLRVGHVGLYTPAIIVLYIVAV